MNARRVILWPLGQLYGIVAQLRRWWFSAFHKRSKGHIPSVVVGNLTVGGTGKTPFVIWLTQQLTALHPAVLSRGYGRKTNGFMEVLAEGLASEFGDEPLEVKQSLGASSAVYVCENRVLGISTIQKQRPSTACVVLDDGFQHLPLMPDMAILLCDYNRPFWLDVPIPAGNLREFPSAATYAQAIVVTKCPTDLSSAEAGQLRKRLEGYSEHVFFAHYASVGPLNDMGETLPVGAKVVAVSALAQNQAFIRGIQSQFEVRENFGYRDHHRFDEKDIQDWRKAQDAQGAAYLLTTRKDWMRMRPLHPAPQSVFYLFTEVNFLFNGEKQLIDLLLKQIQR